MIARFDRFTFDSGRRVLLDGGRDITPAPRVFDVLEVLIQHAPNAVEKDTLALRVWKDATPQDGSLSTAIGELRKALGDAGGSPRIIRTVHGFGYRLAVEVARDADQRQPAAAPRCWLAIGDRTIPLASGEATIGRDPASTIWLDNLAVSWHHARLLVDETTTLEDLGSTNGTFVGGTRLKRRVTLRSEDRIVFGDVAATFHLAAGQKTPTRQIPR
jgi:DNA-binding winged helix-turn-helix (wHTH) protein